MIGAISLPKVRVPGRRGTYWGGEFDWPNLAQIAIAAAAAKIRNTIAAFLIPVECNSRLPWSPVAEPAGRRSPPAMRSPDRARSAQRALFPNRRIGRRSVHDKAFGQCARTRRLPASL